MTLTDKARGLHKQSMLGGLALSHLGQNLIGKPIATSNWLKKDIGRAGIMGALGKQSPRSAKSYGKDAVMGIAAPEVNAIKNTAYTEGRKAGKKLHNEIRKNPEYKAARKAQKANGGDLKLPTSVKRKIVKERLNAAKHGVSKSDIKEIQALPKGSRLPSSTKAAVAANAALAVVPGGASTAIVNAGKLATGTKAYSNSKLGKMINDKLVSKPLKKHHNAGKAGSKFNSAANTLDALAVNPFTAHANKLAHDAGKTLNKTKK